LQRERERERLRRETTVWKLPFDLQKKQRISYYLIMNSQVTNLPINLFSQR
jgi:hypothetical protein